MVETAAKDLKGGQGPQTKKGAAVVAIALNPDFSYRCRHRRGGVKRAKSVSDVTHSQPVSIANAACAASGTSVPRTPGRAQSSLKMFQCCAPGLITEQCGNAKSASKNSNAAEVLLGGLKIFGFVTTRTKPSMAGWESANGSGPSANSVSQFA